MSRPRTGVLAAALLVSVVMAPGLHAASAADQQLWDVLPVPQAAARPAPPAPAGFQPAPVPNPDLLPPRGAPPSADPSLAPHLFAPPNRFAGDGYNPGSTVQSEQERRLRPGAGFNLNLPFQ